MRRGARWAACAVAAGITAPSATAQAQSAVLPLSIAIDTHAEWARVEVRGAQLHVVGRSVSFAGDADLAAPLVDGQVVQVRQPSRATRRVEARIDLAIGLTGEPLCAIASAAAGAPTRIVVRSGSRVIAAGEWGDPAPPRLWAIDPARLAAPLPRRDWGRRVLAFYYGWWGTPTGPARAWLHWNPAAPDRAVQRLPTLGVYDSADPAVLRQHVAWARQAGIDTLVVSLWTRGAHQDLMLARLLDAAREGGLTVAGYLEAAASSDDLRAQVQSYLKAEMAHPAWLTVHGDKVLFLYTRVLAAVDPPGLRRALADLPVRAIGDGLRREWLDATGGVHAYVSFIAPAQHREAFRLMRQRARLADKLAVATAMPGYDDTPVRFPGGAIARDGGRVYQDDWRSAALADWVVVTSFNELHEGSQIEPTVDEGMRWIERTRAFADAFRRVAP